MRDVRPSYEAINYALRPAKAIERRMLCEVFRRLYPFQPIHKYGYIGFGSIYFTDFQLIHRDLGITDLISIEREIEHEDRFILNQPLGCIDLRFADSKEILPALDWKAKRIVWLDYDGRLDQDVLADVGTVTTHVQPGSMLVVSVNSHADAPPPEEERRNVEKRTGEKFCINTYRLEQLSKRLGGKVPKTLEGKDLKGEGLARASRSIILAQINENLTVRNKLLRTKEQVTFSQVVYFTYKDGALMMTLGLVFHKRKQQVLFDSCTFSELKFFRDSDKFYTIKAPCLTPREIHYLNSFLPASDARPISNRGIPEDDIQRYSEIYRYFPAFSEILNS